MKLKTMLTGFCLLLFIQGTVWGNEPVKKKIDTKQTKPLTQISEAFRPALQKSVPLTMSPDAESVLIINEGFEGTFPPNRWDNRRNSTGNYYFWGKENNTAYEGSNSAWCVGGEWNALEPALNPAADDYPNNTDSWFVFGPFNVHDAETWELQFAYNHSVTDYDDNLFCGTSVDGYNFLNQITRIRNESTNGWTVFSQALNAPENIEDRYSVFLGFNFYSDASETSLGSFIDNVQLTKSVAETPEIELIEDTGHRAGGYYFGSGTGAFGMKLTSSGRVKVQALRFLIKNTSNFKVSVLDFDNNSPGEQLWESTVNPDIPNHRWFTLDVSDKNILVENEFFVSCEVSDSLFSMGYDDATAAETAWDYYNGQWHLFEGPNYMIQAIVIPVKPPQAILNQPGQSAANLATDVIFTWDVMEPLDGMTYDLLVDTKNPPAEILGSNLLSTSSTHTLQNDTRYYWQVISKDSYGDTAQSAVYTFYTKPGRFDNATLTLTGGKEQNAYRMISIPGTLDNAAMTQLLSDGDKYKPKQWRLFQEKNDALIEYPNVDDFAPGRAYWMLSKEDKTFSFNGGMNVSTVENFEFSLTSGWNMLGNPFNQTLDWNAIKTQNPDVTLMGPYFYTGTYSDKTTFSPLEGCYVYTQSAGTLIIEGQPSTLAKTKTAGSFSAITSSAAWAVQVHAQCDEAVDDMNYIGMHQEASDGPDAMDWREPPVIGDYISLTFPHDDWDDVSDLYTSDFIALSESGHQWAMQVETRVKDKPVSLTLSGAESLPAGWSLMLYDDVTGSLTNLKDQPVYLYKPAARESKRSFQLFAAPEAEMESQINGMGLPKQFVLYQSYPNPFNSQCHIDYDLPKGGRVKIIVTDGLGRQITVLKDSYEKPGRQSVSWDASNVSSGLYFIHVKSPDGSKSIKTLHMK